MPRRLLISDANIIIDMDTGGLLRLMFRLDADVRRSRHPV